MKLLKLFCAFALLFTFISCESNLDEQSVVLDEKIETRSNATTFERNGLTYTAGAVEITCNGTCTGNNMGGTPNCRLGSDLNGNFECSCAGCKMVFTSAVAFTDHDLRHQMNVDNHDEKAQNFMVQKHNEEFHGFKSVEYNFSPERTTALYVYTLNNGDIETVMYVNEYDSNGSLSNALEIDCTGGCGCREQYHHDTKTSSCSCDDCKMKVTDVK